MAEPKPLANFFSTGLNFKNFGLEDIFPSLDTNRNGVLDEQDKPDQSAALDQALSRIHEVGKKLVPLYNRFLAERKTKPEVSALALGQATALSNLTAAFTVESYFAKKGSNSKENACYNLEALKPQMKESGFTGDRVKDAVRFCEK